MKRKIPVAGSIIVVFLIVLLSFNSVLTVQASRTALSSKFNSTGVEKGVFKKCLALIIAYILTMSTDNPQQFFSEVILRSLAVIISISELILITGSFFVYVICIILFSYALTHGEGYTYPGPL